VTAPLVFLDSSCWIAATLNPTGGAGKIVKLASLGCLAVVVSPVVMGEVLKILSEKFGQEELEDFVTSLAIPEFYSTLRPSKEECEAWSEVTDASDCHVLAAAFSSGCDFLVTLDKRHLLTNLVRDKFMSPVLSPGEFLDWYYRQEEKPVELIEDESRVLAELEELAVRAPTFELFESEALEVCGYYTLNTYDSLPDRELSGITKDAEAVFLLNKYLPGFIEMVMASDTVICWILLDEPLPIPVGARLLLSEESYRLVKARAFERRFTTEHNMELPSHNIVFRINNTKILDDLPVHFYYSPRALRLAVPSLQTFYKLKRGSEGLRA